MQRSAVWGLYPVAGFLKRRTASWLVLASGTCRNYMPDWNTPMPSSLYLNLNRFALRELYIGHRMLETVKLVLNINLDSILLTRHCTNFTVMLDIQSSKKHIFSGHACFCQHKKFKTIEETCYTVKMKKFSVVHFLVLQASLSITSRGTRRCPG